VPVLLNFVSWKRKRAGHSKKDANKTKHFFTCQLDNPYPSKAHTKDSKMSNNSSTKSIPVRRVQIHDAHQMPSRYSETPGGTIFSTTPGGIKLVNIFFIILNLNFGKLYYILYMFRFLLFKVKLYEPVC